MSKGSQPRPYNPAAFDSGWDRVFNKGSQTKPPEALRVWCDQHAEVSAKPSDTLDLLDSIEPTLVKQRHGTLFVAGRYPCWFVWPADDGAGGVRSLKQAITEFITQTVESETIPLDPAPGSP